MPSLKNMALLYLVWAGLMNRILLWGHSTPTPPMCDGPGRLPKKYREADSQSKFGRLGMSYVRTPRRRLWVTTIGIQITIRFGLSTQNSEEVKPLFCRIVPSISGSFYSPSSSVQKIYSMTTIRKRTARILTQSGTRKISPTSFGYWNLSPLNSAA